MLTGKTLDQILGVLGLTKRYHKEGLPVTKAYNKAVNDISEKYSVKYQTIADGCRRRLNLDNRTQFTDLIIDWFQGDPTNLKRLLLKNINEDDAYKIENFFEHQGRFSVKNIETSNSEKNFSVISLKIPKDLNSGLEVISSIRKVDIKGLINDILQEYVDMHYENEIKEMIESMSEEGRKVLIQEVHRVAKEEGYTLKDGKYIK